MKKNTCTECKKETCPLHESGACTFSTEREYPNLCHGHPSEKGCEVHFELTRNTRGSQVGGGLQMIDVYKGTIVEKKGEKDGRNYYKLEHCGVWIYLDYATKAVPLPCPSCKPSEKKVCECGKEKCYLNWCGEECEGACRTMNQPDQCHGHTTPTQAEGEGCQKTLSRVITMDLATLMLQSGIPIPSLIYEALEKSIMKAEDSAYSRGKANAEKATSDHSGYIRGLREAREKAKYAGPQYTQEELDKMTVAEKKEALCFNSGCQQVVDALSTLIEKGEGKENGCERHDVLNCVVCRDRSGQPQLQECGYDKKGIWACRLGCELIGQPLCLPICTPKCQPNQT